MKKVIKLTIEGVVEIESEEDLKDVVREIVFDSGIDWDSYDYVVDDVWQDGEVGE